MISIVAMAKAALLAAALATAHHTVTVQPGNTLSGIAYAHHVGLAPVEAVNPQIADPDLIYPGQRVNLPANGWQPAQAVGEADPGPAPPQRSVSPAYVPKAASGPIRASAGAMPPAMARCIVGRESGGSATAVNPASGAGGLWQIMPGTWAGLGYAGAYPGGAQTAPVAVQDQAAAQLYAQAGGAPWASDGCPGT